MAASAYVHWINILYERLWEEDEIVAGHYDVTCLVPNLVEETILIRNEYTEIRNYVEKSRSSPYERFSRLAILGQPGHGERVRVNPRKAMSVTHMAVEMSPFPLQLSALTRSLGAYLFWLIHRPLKFARSPPSSDMWCKQRLRTGAAGISGRRRERLPYGSWGFGHEMRLISFG